MNLSAGTQLSHYVLERQIGAGGMGTVWEARDARGGRPVALKVLRSQQSLDTARVRVLREARATQRLSHPAIVPIIEVLDYEDSPVLVMPLLQGETLRARLEREQRLSLQECAMILLPIAEALTEAHHAGIVHRDLKPENIFIVRDDASPLPAGSSIRLLDFGVARTSPARSEVEQTPITALGSLVGTLAYMAPEQALRPSESDQRVDVWAFGVTLYEALSGCRPIEGQTAPEMMRQLLVGGITPLSVLEPELPRAVTELVAGMLTRQPERRLPGLETAAITLLAHGGARRAR